MVQVAVFIAVFVILAGSALAISMVLRRIKETERNLARAFQDMEDLKKHFEELEEISGILNQKSRDLSARMGHISLREFEEWK